MVLQIILSYYCCHIICHICHYCHIICHIICHICHNCHIICHIIVAMVLQIILSHTSCLCLSLLSHKRLFWQINAEYKFVKCIHFKSLLVFLSCSLFSESPDRCNMWKPGKNTANRLTSVAWVKNSQVAMFWQIAWKEISDKYFHRPERSPDTLIGCWCAGFCR